MGENKMTASGPLVLIVLMVLDSSISSISTDISCEIIFQNSSHYEIVCRYGTKEEGQYFDIYKNGQQCIVAAFGACVPFLNMGCYCEEAMALNEVRFTVNSPQKNDVLKCKVVNGISKEKTIVLPSVTQLFTEIILTDMTENKGFPMPENKDFSNKGFPMNAIRIIASLSVVCVLFCFTTAALFFKNAFRVWLNNRRRIAVDIKNENDYAYIELPLTDFTMNAEREDNTARSVDLQNVDPVPSCSGAMKLDEKLESNSSMISDESTVQSFVKTSGKMTKKDSAETSYTSMDNPKKYENWNRNRQQACGNRQIEALADTDQETEYSYADECTVRSLVQKSRDMTRRNTEDSYVSMNNLNEYENESSSLQEENQNNVKQEDIPHDYLELH